MAADTATKKLARTSPGRGRLAAAALLLVFTAGGIYAGMRWHATFERWLGSSADPHQDQASTSGSPAKKQLWTCGMHPQVIQDKPGDCPICHMKLTPLVTGDAGGATSSAPAHAAAAGERKVKYWHDPMMNPPYISDRPGKSPMGMDLVPVYEDEAKSAAGAVVTIDPVVVQNMGVRTAVVTQAPLVQSVRATASITEPETARTDINLRVSGWIQKLHANTEGMAVRKGDPLFELYSPDLRLAIEELIAAKRAGASAGDAATLKATGESLIAAAQLRLRTLGLTSEQIEQLGSMEHAPAEITFTSPIDGIVVEKAGAFTGSAVMAGQTVMRLADRSTMWVEARVPERSLSRIRVGQRARVRVDGLGSADQAREGEVVFIHPNLDEMTRTALVRMAVPNPEGSLRAGMFAVAEIDAGSTEPVTIVPREAVIDTGESRIVFVTTGTGRFEPRRVTMGASGADGMVEVVSGVAPGETVVTSGQFLLDSESRLREAIQKFLSQSPSAATPTASPAAPLIADATPEQQKQVDAVVSAYLALSSALGAVQDKDSPVDLAPLITAAHALHGSLTGTRHEPLAAGVAKAAEAMKGHPLDHQRAMFSALGEKVIALVDEFPPSKAAAGPNATLYLMNCPMAPGGAKGDWLQSSPDVANPFFAADMKACGSQVRTIPPRKEERK